MPKKFVVISFFASLLLLIVLFYKQASVAKSAAANYLVISEIQIAGEASGDDFIELYNPTSSQVDLANYRLVKRTSSGSSDSGVIAFTEGDVVAPHGFFLWCNNNISENLSCDKSTSAAVSNNNSVGLRDGALDTGTLIDSVTFGTVANPLGEGTPIDTAPEASQSAERKACPDSTAESMANGDSTNGNAEDTDNNSGDFVTRATPKPQNTESGTETPSCEEPTETPTLTPSPTPTGVPSPTPTEVPPTPTPTVGPTITPTPTSEPTPTVEPTATPTEEPTPTPTSEPTPTVEPTPTTTPSPTPEPSPAPRVIGSFIFPGRRTVCTLSFRAVRFGFFRMLIPQISCFEL